MRSKLADLNFSISIIGVLQRKYILFHSFLHKNAIVSNLYPNPKNIRQGEVCVIFYIQWTRYDRFAYNGRITMWLQSPANVKYLQTEHQVICQKILAGRLWCIPAKKRNKFADGVHLIWNFRDFFSERIQLTNESYGSRDLTKLWRIT